MIYNVKFLKILINLLVYMTHIFVGDYLRKLCKMNFSFGKIWRRAHVSHGEYGDVLSVGHVTTILQFH